MYLDYKNRGLITDEDWEKYNALHLVIRSERYEPQLFQYKVLHSYTKVYSWEQIASRSLHNPKKLINFITSMIFRNHVRQRLAEFEQQHNMNPTMLKNVE